MCHLEIADNAAPCESCHLNSHILCLLCYVPLTEISLVLNMMSKVSPKQHLLQALLNGVCQSLKLWTLWVAQTWFPFAHL